jgi:hypothetical protein
MTQEHLDLLKQQVTVNIHEGTSFDQITISQIIIGLVNLFLNLNQQTYTTPILFGCSSCTTMRIATFYSLIALFYKDCSEDMKLWLGNFCDVDEVDGKVEVYSKSKMVEVKSSE